MLVARKQSNIANVKESAESIDYRPFSFWGSPIHITINANSCINIFQLIFSHSVFIKKKEEEYTARNTFPFRVYPITTSRLTNWKTQSQTDQTFSFDICSIFDQRLMPSGIPCGQQSCRADTWFNKGSTRCLARGEPKKGVSLCYYRTHGQTEKRSVAQPLRNSEINWGRERCFVPGTRGEIEEDRCSVTRELTDKPRKPAALSPENSQIN